MDMENGEGERDICMNLREDHENRARYEKPTMIEPSLTPLKILPRLGCLSLIMKCSSQASLAASVHHLKCCWE